MVSDLHQLQVVKNEKKKKDHRETNLGGLTVQMKYFAISYMFIYFDVKSFLHYMFEYPMNNKFSS